MPAAAHLDHLRVVLVSTRNPLNIGAAARAMSNFGFRSLRLVKPYGPSFREARSAVGAEPLLKQAEEFESVAEAVADCSLVVGTTAAHNRELQHPLRPLAEGAEEIRQRLQAGPVAVLFGSEKRGLSNQDFSYCHWLMRIPTREVHASMNLGQAVAVCLYEIARGVGEAPIAKAKSAAPKVAAASDLERLTTTLLETLRLSGYIKPGSAEITEEKVRRMLRRQNLSTEDAELWLGMLRKIVWKIKEG